MHDLRQPQGTTPAAIRPNYPTSILSASCATAESPKSESRVGILLRRVRYIARLAYWVARHRSLSRARWVLAYEGIQW